LREASQPITRCSDSRLQLQLAPKKRTSARATSKAVSDDRFQNVRLKSAPALNQIYDEDDESNYEQKVDQAAANVTEQAEKPEH